MDRRLLLASLIGAPAAAGAATQPDVAAFESLAALRAGRSGEAAVAVLGHGAPGDGGGGLFLRQLSLDAADDDATLVVDAAGQRWRRLYDGAVDVRWAGAKCDGKADDSAAIAKAARIGPIVIATGVCRIASALQVAAHCRIEAGARLAIEPGASVAFAAGFEAPLAQVFSGAGRVSFDPRFHTVGHPEWWGAKGWLPSQPAPGPDCLAALDACVEACAVTELQAVDYWVSDTWKICSDSRTIRGVGVNGQGPNLATRLIIHSHDLDTVLIGSDQPPPGGARVFLSRVVFSHVTVTRSLPPAAPASGVGGPSGLRLQFVQNIHVEDVWSIENTNGFYVNGVVFSAFDRCFASRVSSGPTAGNDYFAGFLLDARARIGMNTGLASLYIRNKCGAHGGVHASPTYGVRTVGGCTDVFIDAFETAAIEHGLWFDGESDVAYPSENLRVSNCVLDQVKTGIAIRRGNAATNITLINNYCAPSAAGGSIAVLVQQTPLSGLGGAVSLVGNELIGSGGETIGLMVDGSSGVIASGNLYTDLSRPVVLHGARGCRIVDRISNVAHHASGPAVELAGSAQCVVDASVGGAPNAFQAGVALAACRAVEVRCSGIEAAALSGPKLTAEGRGVDTTGPFGAGCLAQGLVS
jgi:hypothetical protein